MSQKLTPPGLVDSFSCPHCGALAHQTWFKTYLSAYGRDEYPIEPKNIKEDIDKHIESDHNLDDGQKERLKRYFYLLDRGQPFFPDKDQSVGVRIINTDFTWCYSCKGFAIWVAGKIVYPQFTHDILPNDDLPNDIKLDFTEAQQIVSTSPRGAAALLRLSIQKMCKYLGEKGKNINEDIGSLVKKGLDVKIQRALDVVRVVGNEAVHPGQIDLRDDLEVANKLFILVNLIADALITQPKMVDALFTSMPSAKLAEIEKRDTISPVPKT